MKNYVKIFPIKDGYKAVENEINKHLSRKNGTTKILSISGLGEHHIIAAFEKDVTEQPTTDDKADTPTETDFAYFTAEQARNMSYKEIKENYSDIRKSMELW